MEPVARSLTDLLLGRLGDACRAVSVHGSAAHGGLRHESDLDLLVTLRESLSEEDRAALLTELLAVSGRRAARGPARPVELTAVVLEDLVPWRYPPRSDFQYGEWLRDEYLAGVVPRPGPDPDLAVLLTSARLHALPVHGPHPGELFEAVPERDLRRAILESLPALVGDLPGDERNVVLTLARMRLTLSSGQVEPKDVAAAWLAERVDQDDRRVLAMARAGYLGERADRWDTLERELHTFVERSVEVIELAAREP